MTNTISTSTRRLTLLALLLALMALLTFTNLGFIAVPPVSITIMYVPVLVALLCEGLGAGLLMALFFGLFSLLKALTSANLVDKLFFQYPWLAIAPRLCIPLAAWGVYRLVMKLTEGKRQRTLAWPLAALCGSLTNTVLVLGGLYLIGQPTMTAMGIAPELLGGVLLSVALTNGLLEAIIAALLVPAILYALARAKWIRV